MGMCTYCRTLVYTLFNWIHWLYWKSSFNNIIPFTLQQKTCRRLLRKLWRPLSVLLSAWRPTQPGSCPTWRNSRLASWNSVHRRTHRVAPIAKLWVPCVMPRNHDLRRTFSFFLFSYLTSFSVSVHWTQDFLRALSQSCSPFSELFASACCAELHFSIERRIDAFVRCVVRMMLE